MRRSNSESSKDVNKVSCFNRLLKALITSKTNGRWFYNIHLQQKKRDGDQRPIERTESELRRCREGSVLELEPPKDLEISAITEDEDYDKWSLCREQRNVENELGMSRYLRRRSSGLPTNFISKKSEKCTNSTKKGRDSNHKHNSKKKSKKMPPSPLRENENSNDARSHCTPETVDSSAEWEEAAEPEEIDQIVRDGDTAITMFVDDFELWEFEELVDSVLGNKSLTSVEVYRLTDDSNTRVRSEEEMKALFGALRGLPSITEIILWNFDDTDLDLITSLVKRHGTIEKFRLHFTHGAIGEALLADLAEVPLLSDISLEMQESFPLSDLLSSKTLTHLRIPSKNFDYSDDYFVKAMQALESNDTLRVLDVRPRLSRLSMRALSFAIEENYKMERLCFSYLETDQEAGKALVDLAQALSRNSTLKSIKNHMSAYLSIKKVHEETILEMLNHNETLEVLDIFDDDDCMSVKDSILGDNKRRKKGFRDIAKGWLDGCSMFECAVGFE